MFVSQRETHSRLHAKALDKSLGYKIPKIEVKLLQKYRAYDQVGDDSSRKQHYQGTQAWVGLHPQALQTPYCDIYEALSLLRDANIEHVVDIGAGYGRVGMVLSVLYPNAKFTGYEIVKQRQVEGNRIFSKFDLPNANIELRNVLEEGFELPKADVYFIYDFSEKEHVHSILKELAQRVDQYGFFLITRGERVDHLMERQYRRVWKSRFVLEASDLKVYSAV